VCKAIELLLDLPVSVISLFDAFFWRHAVLLSSFMPAATFISIVFLVILISAVHSH
jgi:hypothetical protein